MKKLVLATCIAASLAAGAAHAAGGATPAAADGSHPDGAAGGSGRTPPHAGTLKGGSFASSRRRA